MINKADKIGGAAAVAWNLKNELAQQGHTVNFFVGDKQSADANVFAIPRSRWRFYLSHLLGTDIDLFQTDYIIGTEQFKQAEIVLCHNLHGHYFNLKTLVKMSRLKPVVWALHDLWAVTPYCSQAPGKKLRRGFYGCAITSSKSIVKYFNQFYLRRRKEKLYQDWQINLVAPSLWLKNKLAGTILASQSLTLIHHGINTDLFTPSDKTALRQKLGLPLDKKIVLFAANGGKNNLWKGWSGAREVIKNFAERPDVLFLCVGGQANASTRANLRFVNYVADEALMADYFKAADAFLLTSPAESFALVVIEALAAGLPVVGFAVGIMGEVIKHRVNGYVAKYLDNQDLARGLHYVLNFRQTDKDRLAAVNQELIKQKFTLKIMADKYLKLFDEAIAQY